MSVHFIDVGQGDSIFIVCGERTMLIDAGESEYSGSVINYIESLGIERIDTVVSSHPHSDHIGGLPDVIERFDIGDIYMPRVQANTSVFEDLLDAILAKGLSAQSPEPGDCLMLDSAEITFLGPIEIDDDNLNNCSIVLSVRHGERSFLLMGDAENSGESDILFSDTDIDADVLKVAHHGSETGTGSGFLRAVSPEIAVISVGDENNYGHPDVDILARLASVGANVYRTDLSGYIIITSDGEALEVMASGSAELPAGALEPAVAERFQYIGNVNSRKFHLPSCSSLPAERNRVFFNTREEAIDEEYTPCGRCKP